MFKVSTVVRNKVAKTVPEKQLLRTTQQEENPTLPESSPNLNPPPPPPTHSFVSLVSILLLLSRLREHDGESLISYKILHISYKDHVTNEEVRAKIKLAIRPHEDPLTTVKRRKLQWYGLVSRSSGLTQTILQGTVKGRRQGRQRKR